MSLIVSEFVELEGNLFVSVGERFNNAPGGGSHAWDVVAAETKVKCYGEGHLAHKVDGGDDTVGEGEYFVEVLIGQVGDVLLIASGGDIGKGEVNDVAELLLCSSELCGVPKGGGVVGKVD